MRRKNLINAIKTGAWTEAENILTQINNNNPTANTTIPPPLISSQTSQCGDYNVLHWACMNPSTPPSTLRLLLRSTSLASKTAQDERGRTPLHSSIIFFKDDERILLMIDACPAAVAVTNNHGRLPLHAAIKYGRQGAVIRRLLEVCPGAVTSVNSDVGTPFEAVMGGSPLCLFFQRWECRGLSEWGDEEGLEVLSSRIGGWMVVRWMSDVAFWLLEAFVCGGIGVDDGFCVLCAALTVKSCSWQFFRLLLLMNPERVFRTNGRGCSVLHVALSMRPLDDDKISNAIQTLVSLNPSAANYHNNSLRLPLSLALEGGKLFEDRMVQGLFRASPSSLRTRDCGAHMYPFMLAAIKQRENDSRDEIEVFESCYRLLIEGPDLVTIYAVQSDV